MDGLPPTYASFCIVDAMKDTVNMSRQQHSSALDSATVVDFALKTNTVAGNYFVRIIQIK